MHPGTTALARGLDALGALADAPGEDGLGVVRLAELVGCDKSQMSRTLQTLEDRGFVERDDRTLAYRIGWRCLALADRAGERRLLVAARPLLHALVRDLGESAHLSVREGDAVLTLLSESPASTLHAPGRVGSLSPIATTAAGRALVLDAGPDELAALGLTAVAAAIAAARDVGFAIVREEFEPGLVAAAAPVRGPGGRIVAALNVSAPRFRFDDRLEAAGVLVAAAAGRVSAALRGEPAA